MASATEGSSVGSARKRETDQAGQAEQPEAGRAIIARKLQVGPRKGRRARDP